MRTEAFGRGGEEGVPGQVYGPSVPQSQGQSSGPAGNRPGHTAPGPETRSCRPSRSGAVILTGNCRRAPCVHTRVSVQAGHTCPWRRPGQPRQPPQAPARFQLSACERPQAWLEPLGLPASTRSGGRQIPNLDRTPPEAVGQACWDALPWAGCVSGQLSAGHTPGWISARG